MAREECGGLSIVGWAGDRTKSDDGEGARLEGSFRSEWQEHGSHVWKSQQAPMQLTSEE